MKNLTAVGGPEYRRWCIDPRPSAITFRFSARFVLRNRHDLMMKSRVHPKYKTKYRVSNWAEYDRALVQRGDITSLARNPALADWGDT